MPVIRLSVNRKLTFQQQISIKRELGKIIEILPNKTEEKLMLHFEENQVMYYKGDEEPCSMTEITLFQQSPLKEKKEFIEAYSNMLTTITRIPADRQYACFHEHENFAKGPMFL
ncbi:hypothetical protein [Tannockella kyphosi]|uniref:hypothetical protein n=1 Tax=Tannockella kyphosi TaxID=2899121 RepID=UPI0020139276|nr:hypothetical protein [Tannockella kyphosi]